MEKLAKAVLTLSLIKETMSSSDDHLSDMPPEIYFWINDDIDGGDLEPFLGYYAMKKDLYQNKVDFINGFTLAVAYLHHEKFSLKDLKWIRIAMSTALVKALTSAEN